jgi:hypothetical protein
MGKELRASQKPRARGNAPGGGEGIDWATALTGPRPPAPPPIKPTSRKIWVPPSRQRFRVGSHLHAVVSANVTAGHRSRSQRSRLKALRQCRRPNSESAHARVGPRSGGGVRGRHGHRWHGRAGAPGRCAGHRVVKHCGRMLVLSERRTLIGCAPSSEIDPLGDSGHLRGKRRVAALFFDTPHFAD